MFTGTQSNGSFATSVDPSPKEVGFVTANVSNRALLQMEGSESTDLLQRISTNDVSKAAVGAWVDTILTSEKGRIIDVISVHVASPEKLLLACQSKSPAQVRNWIEKFIIMESIRVTDVTSQFDHFLILPTPEALAERKDIKSFKPNGLLSTKAITFEQTWGEIMTFHVLVEKRAGTTESGYISEDEFETLRIRLGIPSNPNELSPAYNPLEANLHDKVNFTKGCYVGQEVIARLDTYKKLQRKLVRLEIQAPIGNAPRQICCGSEEVGTLTSAAEVGNSKSIALGYVKLHSIGQDLHLNLGTAQVAVSILQ